MSVFAVARSLKLTRSLQNAEKVRCSVLYCKDAIQNGMAFLSNKYGVGYQ